MRERESERDRFEARDWRRRRSGRECELARKRGEGARSGRRAPPKSGRAPPDNKQQRRRRRRADDAEHLYPLTTKTASFTSITWLIPLASLTSFASRPFAGSKPFLSASRSFVRSLVRMQSERTFRAYLAPKSALRLPLRQAWPCVKRAPAVRSVRLVRALTGRALELSRRERASERASPSGDSKRKM